MESVAIFVSGGPAPGINAVIHAATIHLEREGYRALGVRGGFRDIAQVGSAAFVPLTTQTVSRIAHLGGSFLGTSRNNPFAKEEESETLLHALRLSGVRRVIVIGGEGSAYLSLQLAQKGFTVAHVPKTIDNDIPIPGTLPSFGYETARAVAAEVVQTLMTDAKSCERWYFVETMGRSSGALALGIGIAAGATATFLPEEFSGRKFSVAEVAEQVFEVIQTRYRRRRRHGVILFGEGILDTLDERCDERLHGCARDALGRLILSELNVCDLLRPYVSRLANEASIECTVKVKSIGYELRSAAPCAFDLEYCKFLGFAAAQYLTAHTPTEGEARLVYQSANGPESISLFELADPQTGRIPARTVNLNSMQYAVAREFMLRSKL